MRHLPTPTNSAHRDRGLSLIELVVAMALFALVAIMGAQGLSGMLRLRDNLHARSEASADLAQAISLLRRDMSSAVPMPFFSPDNGPILSALIEDTQGFSVSVGGQPTLQTSGRLQPVFHRVSWRIQPRSGLFSRQRWSTLTPLNSTALGPEVPVLNGVISIRMRSYWGELGWVNGLRPPLQAVQSAPNQDEDSGSNATVAYSSGLPDGVEITLVTEKHGELVLLESLK
ncbi:prepilin-type N-terminal cleavage/methylation domain-containing protein [Shimia sagamensis]|uniref:Type II secretion system protein J (GspJ) n=1 Tax=Shimia sagamensis TaxID=1566352 RepID=A0ABY1NBM1_9RHOB|nr:prepilin-type N-terminal cleavage/methylation domain-containing protein [Shimia sagamensis]SMP05738.1 type II secretion system protein J (GspJ) [Shimia sagamensis]